MSGIDVAEANAQIPRQARFDDDIVTALGFTLFFFVLWLIPAAWGTYGYIKGAQLRDILRREGHDANGEVTESHAGRGGVYVIYRFSVDGVFYSGRAEMISDRYKVKHPGEEIPIRYLLGDPSVNQPVDWEWFSVSYLIFLLLGLGLLIIAGASVIAGSRKKSLTRMGIVVEGRVTGCAPDRKVFTVYYEFTTEDKTGMEGSTTMPEECAAGDSIPVMYLRSNPKRNDFYPL
ncbi:MAG: DUF3592 domain-containing protein [Terracidiphilus sp.]